MGIAIPQVVTSDRATGAQIIDGSLLFEDGKNQYLKRTAGSGNQKTYTFSTWIKRGVGPARIFGDYHDPNYTGIDFSIRGSDDAIEFHNYDGSSYVDQKISNDKLRDRSGWYHAMYIVDTTESADEDKIKIYVNGRRITSWATNTVGTATNGNTNGNTATEQRIGYNYQYSDQTITQTYFIDGQALGPEYFGFTDGLTNTWKPKKYTGTFTGTNTFYLPFDGNSPIGQDKSGNGNDWTPVNFGGSVALDNPQVSGARPILNTTQGGTQAGVGVFGSKQNVGYAVTVYNDGGGNKYYIDGVKQDTVTGLIRGATYTFDTSDSTVSSHPFRFSATSNGSHGGGSEYTSGVAAITGTATTITVPHDAPNTLYYYCTSHSGMGADITGITTNEKLADQYASHCTLALPLVGSDDDVCASIACTAHNKTVTNSSVTASTTQSNFYNGSHHWSANSDTLNVAQSGDELVFGTGDFTIEFWYFDDGGHSGTGGRTYLFDNRIGGSVTGDPPTLAGWLDGTEVNLYITSGGGTISYVGSAENKWYHYAAVRSGSTVTLYHDGVARGTMTSSTNFTNNGIGVGRATDANYGMAGYIQDFRVYKGVAKYTSDFVVPSRSPDILPDTPSGVSGGSKLAKITDGAVSFDGTGDYLSLADSADFDFGTGDYTAEAFVYAEATTDMYVINQSTDHGGAAPWWGLNVWSNGSSFTIRAGRTDSSGNAKHEVTFHWAKHKWYHFAVSRSSGTSRLYFDGVLLDTKSDTDDIDGNGTLYVGAYNDGSLTWNGFISNVRIVKGTGLYTEYRITPPTAPLTNVTNTKLLCCQSNTSATEGAVKPGTITANGNAIATNFNPFNTDINTVRGQETGYATWNSLSVRSGVTFSDGNLTLTNSGSGSSGWRNVACTQSVTSGKWYVEMHTIGSQNGGLFPGVCKLPDDSGTFNPGTFSNNFPGMTANSYSLNCFSGSKRTNGSDSGYGSAMAVGDMIMMCLDMDNGAIWWGKNGEWFASGDPAANSNAAFTGLSGEFVFACGISASEKIVTNFGQKPFKFAPPDGFQPLNTVNTRPVKVISRPDQYVGVTTYTGDNTASKKINNLLFSPDFVWVKDRNLNFTHFLNDTVRGAGKILQSNVTTAETDNSDTIAAFPSFDPNGFTVGTNSNWQMNGNNEPYVGWCWKAGGSKNTFNVDDVGYANASDINMSASSLNSATYNTSNRWSDDYAGASLSTGYEITKAFDGDRTTTARVEATQTAMSVALTNITVIDKIEVRGERGYITPYVEVTVGGTTHQIGGDPDTLITGSAGTTSRIITGVSGALTNVKVGRVNSGRTYLSQIIVDGKILVDDNITPPNAPSIAATGASVGTKQGFSIIKYDGNGTAGSSIPHGLLQSPEFVIVKDTDDTDNWQIYHKGGSPDGGAKLLKFTGDQATTNDGPWHDTPPSSTTITLGGGGTNDSSNTHICYAWHSVPGLQKFDDYVANGNADGNFIELGFRPAILWIKATGSYSPGNWFVHDSERDKFNPTAGDLQLDRAQVEGNLGSAYYVDFLSNGFKLRADGNGENGASGNTYIYCAWAEAPLVDLFGGGANAR